MRSFRYTYPTMTTSTITKEQFLAYEAVRVSGATNMMDIKTVQRLAQVPLTDENCFEIMKQYDLAPVWWVKVIIT